jgi:stalled ribosome alternative rescue factor ArfA
MLTGRVERAKIGKGSRKRAGTQKIRTCEKLPGQFIITV